MITKFLPKVYRLKNKIQNYSWGTKNDLAYIPKLIGIKPEENIPYAELWIGTHKNLPSEIYIENQLFPLDKIIEKFPKEILGEFVSGKFNNKLPFLLKILSIGQALSIQAHPNKELAKLLHLKDPVNYPDDNHKPEIAIAIDELELIVGVKSFKEFIATINKYPVLKDSLNIAISVTDNKYSKTEQERIIKKIYSDIMFLSNQKLDNIIISLVKQFEKNSHLTLEEKEFLVQYQQFGVDIGLLSILLFNYLKLGKDEAIFTTAGIPHAYLRGNIIECMANSDNVVRAGLTKKYKDIPTLLEMLNYNFNSLQIIKNNDKQIYKYPKMTDEFEITMYNLQKGSTHIKDDNDSIVIILVLENEIQIETEKDFKQNSINITKGEAVLIPANLNYYKIFANNNSKFICVSVPKN